MDEIIREIKEQTEINFINIKDQIAIADLETVMDNESNSRYIFHYLHSLDKFFINPSDYIYEGEKLFGIKENLSVIDSKRNGYINDSSIVITKRQLMDYFDFVSKKIISYLDTLNTEDLIKKPEGCDHTRLELLLGQFRHMMWHVGLSSAITYDSKKEWNAFTGLIKVS